MGVGVRALENRIVMEKPRQEDNKTFTLFKKSGEGEEKVRKKSCVKRNKKKEKESDELQSTTAVEAKVYSLVSEVESEKKSEFFKAFVCFLFQQQIIHLQQTLFHICRRLNPFSNKSLSFI